MFFLILQGLGVVHVLTGPDHLSALATLSAVSDFCSSFFLGVRWGMGHSTGLLLVGVILIIRDYREETDSDHDSRVIDMPVGLSRAFESMVGFFMLFLGAYGFRRAFRKKHEFQGRVAIPSADIDFEEASVENAGTYSGDPHFGREASLQTIAGIVSDEPLASTMEVEGRNYNSSNGADGGFDSLTDSSRRFSARTMAVLAGVVHGLAGPGGVLGVIPAVQLHDWKLAALYLSCFCLSSTLTMGCFASLYGVCSSGIGKKTKLEFQIHLFSAGLSMLVGTTWLVLLALGKLEDVFP